MPGDARAPLRYGLGVASLFVLSQLLDWQLGFLAPLMAAMFLQAPRPPSARAALTLIAVAALLLAGGVVWSALTVRFPAPYFVSLAALLWLTFRFAARGGNPLIVLFALLALLLIPSLTSARPALASIAAADVVLNFAAALAGAALWFAIVPPPTAATQAAAAPPARPDRAEADRRAATMLAIVLPLVAFMRVTDSDNLITLIFVALLVQQVSAAATGAAGRAMLVSNAIGGLVAWLSFTLLVAAPQPLFFVAIVAATLLAAAAFLWSGRPRAKLAGGAVSGYLVLLGGAIAPFGEDFDADFLDRLVQIGMAIAYVLAALWAVDALREASAAKRRRRAAA